MQPFDIPMFLIIEEDALNEVMSKINTEFLTKKNNKIMILTSSGVYNLFKNNIEKMKNDYKDVHVFFLEDSSYDVAVDIAKSLSIEDYDLIIGFGGGRVLDTAKYASYVSKKKYVSIPTALSNDGLASPIAVLKTHDGKAKSFGCKSPDGIIIDTKIILNSPRTLLMAGIGDTVSNYTSLHDWQLESKHKDISTNDFAYLLSDTALNMLLHSREENVDNIYFIKQLAQSLVLSGLAMNIAGNSRPCSGSEHLFSHSLDEHYDIDAPHGLKVALGSLASCIFQKRDYKPIVKFLKRYSVDVSPISLGISREIFVEAWMLAQATRPERFSILNTINLNQEYLEETYDEILEVLT